MDPKRKLPPFQYQQRARISQEDIAPGTVRRYHELTAEKAPEVTVYQPGSGYFGHFTDIQDALDYVNHAGGGRVVLMPATYKLTKPLTIYTDTIIEGLGGADCIIDCNSNTFNLATNSGAKHISVIRLSFKNCTNTNGAIHINSADTATINECFFENNAVDIYSSTSRAVYVTGCTAGQSTSASSGTFYKSSGPAGLSWVERNSIYNATAAVFNNASQTNISNNYIRSTYSPARRAGMGRG